MLKRSASGMSSASIAALGLFLAAAPIASAQFRPPIFKPGRNPPVYDPRRANPDPNNRNPRNQQNQNAQTNPVEAIEAGYGGQLREVDIYQYVSNLQAKLPGAKRNEFNIHLLDSEKVNHFSLPDSVKGTHIFLTRGLLQRLDNEAQLVAILSFEMAHTNLGHIQSRIDAAKAKQRKDMWINIAGQAASGRAVNLNINDLFEVRADGTYGGKFEEKEELAAADSAMKEMDEATYDPREFYLYLNTMFKLGNDDRVRENVIFTHGIDVERVAKVKSMVELSYNNEKDTWIVKAGDYATKVEDPLIALEKTAGGKQNGGATPARGVYNPNNNPRTRGIE